MLQSASGVRASESLHDPSYFLYRQLVWLVIGLVTAYVAARVDYRIWRRFVVPLVLLAVVLLVLVFVPAIGVKVGGARRWIDLGFIRLQPSELAKIALVAGLSVWMARIERRAALLKTGLIQPILGIGVICGLLLLEPDFGTTLLCGAVGMLIMCAGGTRMKHLLIAAVTGGCAFALAVLQDPLRLGRVMAFIYPERHPATAYHLAQSKLAFMNGGTFGVHLGNSIQKQLYLPEAHTDFIFAIIGEELGIIATIGIVLVFFAILVCGLIICFRAPDTFGRLFGFGLTMLLVLQAAINIGVVTGCLPTKGLPLPFISYGGSSLVAALTCVGVLLSIAQAGSEGPDDVRRSVKDRGRSF